MDNLVDDISLLMMITINNEWKDVKSDPFYNVDTFCDYLHQYYEYGSSHGHMLLEVTDGKALGIYDIKYKYSNDRWLVTKRI